MKEVSSILGVALDSSDVAGEVSMTFGRNTLGRQRPNASNENLRSLQLPSYPHSRVLSTAQC